MRLTKPKTKGGLVHAMQSNGPHTSIKWDRNWFDESIIPGCKLLISSISASVRDDTTRSGHLFGEFKGNFRVPLFPSIMALTSLFQLPHLPCEWHHVPRLN